MATRFLCDEMLARLARLLRAAGYDTALSQGGEPDSALRRRAETEDRLLLTRDRTLAAQAGARGVLIAGRGVRGEAESLARQRSVDWRHAPFSRCVIDNAPVRDATAEEVARMPQSARDKGGPFRACPACGRLYWAGSHVKRIEAVLEALAQLDDSPTCA